MDRHFTSKNFHELSPKDLCEVLHKAGIRTGRLNEYLTEAEVEVVSPVKCVLLLDVADAEVRGAKLTWDAETEDHTLIQRVVEVLVDCYLFECDS